MTVAMSGVSILMCTQHGKERDMSVDKWAYTPEACDGDICVGDCDLCSKAMPIDEIIEKLEGIRCGFKSTSCPDQLAQALKSYKEQ